MLRQSFPMLFVDSFFKEEGYEYFIGLKNWGQGFFKSDQLPPLTLMIEGAGQTVEYNILQKYFGEVEQKPRFYLAGVNKAQIVDVPDCFQSVYYLVKEISKVGMFYISEIEILINTHDNMVRKAIAIAQIVHSVRV